jgi:hypothetical protein
MKFIWPVLCLAKMHTLQKLEMKMFENWYFKELCVIKSNFMYLKFLIVFVIRL